MIDIVGVFEKNVYFCTQSLSLAKKKTEKTVWLKAMASIVNRNSEHIRGVTRLCRNCMIYSVIVVYAGLGLLAFIEIWTP